VSAPNLDVTLGRARLEHGTKVTVAAAGGGEIAAARVSWLGGPFHQLRLAAAPASRLAVGARITVDGHPGVVLDADAPRHGPGNDLLVRLTRLSRELA